MFEQAQLTKSENWITALHRNSQIAYSASLAVWIVLYFIFPEIGSNDSYQASEIRNAILSAISLGYIAAAFALTFFRDSWIVERFPSWLNISILGSTLSIFFAFLTADAMYYSSIKGGVLWQWYWSGVFIEFVLGTILLSLYTMPFTLLIYYSPNLGERLKRFFG